MPEPTSDLRHLDLSPLPGSERAAAPGVEPAAASLDPSTRIEVTVVLRRKAALPDPAVAPRLSARDLASSYGADESDIEAVTSTLTSLGLGIVIVDAASRSVRVAGTVERLERVFGTSLSAATSGSRPGAGQVVYFAPNTDAGFVDAVSEAAHADAMADAVTLGITVTAAAGDDGSADRTTDGKVHVDFPASSPNALACGGTRLLADPVDGSVSSETVWNNGAGNGATGWQSELLYVDTPREVLNVLRALERSAPGRLGTTGGTPAS